MESLASKSLLKETKEKQKRSLACSTPIMHACSHSIDFVDLEMVLLFVVAP
jgi:hypothetical protein